MQPILSLFSALAICSAAIASPAEGQEPERPTAVLMVVASEPGWKGAAGTNEFLVLRSAGSAIAWEFTSGLHVNVHRKGVVPVDPARLLHAFENVVQIEQGQPKTASPAYYFSLVLLEPGGVRSCVSLNPQQQEELIQGEPLREVFEGVRKKVYGKGIVTYRLLNLGYSPSQTAVPPNREDGDFVPRLPPSRLPDNEPTNRYP